MRHLLVTCLAGASLIVVGCGSKTSQSTTTTSEGKASTAPSGQAAANSKVALVRFVDAFPAGHANLAFGNNELFSNVGYKTVTPYKEVPGERHDFRLTTDGAARARQRQPVTNSEGLTNGNRYTVIAALDKNGAEKLDVINDNLTPPADGKAKMRVINASPEEVNIYAPEPRNANRNEGTADRARHPNANRYTDEDKWFSGVNPASSTTFKDVAPYDGTVDIVPAAHNRRGPAARVPVSVRPGEIYTLVVAGGTGRYPLEAIKIDDHLNETANGNPPASPSR